MFHSDSLVYIQMQKTGCTHIASILSTIFDGEMIGKHNAATQAQLSSNNYFVSSIRNPWDWYLSLWTFGVQGNGALMHRLTRRKLQDTFKLTLNNPKKNYRKLLHELSKSVGTWRDVYDTDDHIESFRNWLRLMHDPKNSRYLGEGYGNTAITEFCGYMTYRYLYLCCRNLRELKNPRLITDLADLVQFDSKHCYIDFFVRQESLEDSLCEAIEKFHPLTQEEKELIYRANKTNSSKRSLLITEYYDKESIELVQSRDRLLVEKFDYSFPKLAECK